MIYCAHCGAQNPAEARFCYRCGKPVVPSPETPPPFNSDPVQTPPQLSYAYSISPTPIGYVLASPEVARYHPLTEGIKWLPADLQAQPREFYSYVNLDDRLVFARRAGFWKRFLATGIDFLVLLVPLFALSYINTITNNKNDLTSNGLTSSTIEVNTANPLISFVLLGMVLTYFFVFGLMSGQSVGKKAFHLRVMRLDGSKPDWMTAAVRYLAGYLLSANLVLLSLIVLVGSGLGFNTTISGLLGLLTFGWGFWWAGWDELKQGWHDKLARTLVVDTREYVEGVHFFKEPLG